MKTGKKLLALFLAVVMTMSVMTVGAFAEEPVDETQNSVEETQNQTPETPAPETPEQTETPTEETAPETPAENGESIPAALLTEAAPAAAATKLPDAVDGVITLTEDVDISETGWVVDGDVTLDLAGHELKAASTEKGNIDIPARASLTLKDSAGTGKVYTETDYTNSATGYAVIDVTGGSFIMESGYVYAVRENPASKGQFALGIGGGGNMTINGGKVEAGWYAISGNGTDTAKTSTVVIKGGELISTADYALYLPHAGETTISDGTIYGAAGGIAINRGTLTVSGGTITSKGQGGTGDWGDGTGGLDNAAITLNAKYGDVNAAITGGDIIAEGDAVVLQEGTDHSVELKVSGGTFSSKIDEKYLAEGYVQNANGEVGRLDEVAVAEATTAEGTKKYATLKDAVDAAADGSTVKLLDDVVLSEVLTLNTGRQVNLDLGNHSISAGEHYIMITHGNLTVTGSGTVSSTNGNYTFKLVGAKEDVSDYSVLTIEKGAKVTSTGYGAMISPYVSSADGVHYYGTKITINGTVDSTLGLYVNGTLTKTSGNVPAITVGHGASVTGGLYAAGYAKYNVAGSIKGNDFGIEIRAGELTVEDTATITASGAFSDPAPNGNGSTVTGAAIAVSQHTTNLPIKVEIKGGNISETGTNGYALYEIDTVPNESSEDVAKEVSISVTGGTFSGGVHSTNNKLSISGGYFTSDPGTYVADGYAAVSNDDARYIYKVVAAVADETPVKPTVKEPEVESKIQNVDEATKKAIEEAAKSVEVPALGAEAAKVAVSDGEKTEAVKKAVTELNVSENDIIVYTQAYLDIVTTSYEKTGENVSVTMDITPKVQLVASTAKTGDGIVLDGGQKNAVTYGNPEELTISGPTVVTVQLPEATFGGKAVFIKHEASKGTYFYKATAAADGTITFTSHHGFSPFTFSTANEAVAEIGEIGYPTLKAAIDAAKDNDTIKLLKDCSETVTISKEISFKLEKAAGVNFTGKIEAGYRYSVSEKDGTYTVTYVGGGSSGGGSSSSSGRYTVKVDSGKHGEVKVSSKRADKGDTITITVDPDKGYVLDELTVTDKDGDTVKVKSKSDTKFTFTMPASDVTVEATFTAEKEETLPFADIPEDFWAVKEITWAYGKGYMNGVSADQFAPGRTVTRQQLWMVLARLAGEQPADMTAARKWAVENGVSDGSNPGGALTRQQMVAILYRYAKLMGYDVTGSADLTAFPDHASVADYAKEAMAWSVKNEIVGGTAQGTLNPAGTANRAQFAVILYRFCGNVL